MAPPRLLQLPVDFARSVFRTPNLPDVETFVIDMRPDGARLLGSDDPYELEELLHTFVGELSECYGVDLEWQPARRGERSDVDLAILSAVQRDRVIILLIRTVESKTMPPALVELLGSPPRPLYAAGWFGGNDEAQWARAFPTYASPAVTELQRSFFFRHLRSPKTSLDAMAAEDLGLRHTLEKFDYRRSAPDWRSDELDLKHKAYAATDGLLVALLGQAYGGACGAYPVERGCFVAEVRASRGGGTAHGWFCKLCGSGPMEDVRKEEHEASKEHLRKLQRLAEASAQGA